MPTSRLQEPPIEYSYLNKPYIVFIMSLSVLVITCLEFHYVSDKPNEIPETIAFIHMNYFLIHLISLHKVFAVASEGI